MNTALERAARCAVAAVLLSPFAAAQSLNIDLGPAVNMGFPQPSHGAASFQTGIWNEVLGTQGLFGNIVDVFGTATPVDLSLSTGNAGRCNLGCTGALPPGSEAEALLDDYLRFNGTLVVEFRDLDPGSYEVYAYAWAPDNAAARTNVFGTSVGGAWPANDNYLAGRTHASKGNFVVTSAGELRFEMTVDHTFGTLNALQLIKISPTIGTSYCAPLPNSTGDIARLIAFGSDFALEDSFFLGVDGLPPNQFGFFLTSPQQGSTTIPGSGLLCLDGPIGRFSQPHQIWNAGPDGSTSLQLPLNAHPTPTGTTVVVPGSTYYYQAWYRDAGNGAPASNLSDGRCVQFR